MTDSENNLHIMFDVGGDRFAAPIGSINHILRYGGISPIPGSSKNMIGISEVRGNTIPIMNTAALLGMGDKQFTEDNFIMLSDKEGKSIGFAVDKMSGNINIDNNKKNMPDGMAENSSYITGTVNTDDGIVVIVDLIKMGDMG